MRRAPICWACPSAWKGQLLPLSAVRLVVPFAVDRQLFAEEASQWIEEGDTSYLPDYTKVQTVREADTRAMRCAH